MDAREAAGHLPAMLEKLSAYIAENGRIEMYISEPGLLLFVARGETMTAKAAFQEVAGHKASFIEKTMLKTALASQAEAIDAAADVIKEWAARRIAEPPGRQADRLAIGKAKSSGDLCAIACNSKGEAFALWWLKDELAAIGIGGEEEE